MRESRMIIILFILSAILIGPFLYIIYLLWPNLCDYIGIATNLYCGIIVGLITSICEYIGAKKRIQNNIYGAYFSAYRTYYYTKNMAFLGHHNVYHFYKKLEGLDIRINDALDEYYGFFKKFDIGYKKLNPNIRLWENLNKRKILKMYLSWFNKKSFIEVYEPLINNIEKILVNVNKTRFEKDKNEMIKLFDYMHKNIQTK